MEDAYKLYKSQYKKAKETLDILEKQKAEINFNLKTNPACPNLHKNLRDINMDIRITLNEIEHVESNIQDCELRHNASIS